MTKRQQVLTFDSRSVAGGDGFDEYRAIYGFGADVERSAGNFSATIAARHYSRLNVFERTLSGAGHERSRRRVATGEFDHAIVFLMLSGRMRFETPDERRWLNPGEMVAFDMRRPQRTWSEGAHHILVSVPRDRLEEAMSPTTHFHGHILTGEPIAIVRDYIRLLAGCGSSMKPAMLEAVAASLGLLLGAMLGGDAKAPRAAIEAARKTEAAMRYIRQNARRATLSAQEIADHVDVSRSALYRMFEQQGGVHRTIKQQRLLEMRRALSRPGETRLITEIAIDCGFISDPHANRSFRENFGVTPGEYRDAGRNLVANMQARQGFSHWYDDF